MVKVLVNGVLFEISKVEEIVEKRVPFNGTNIRLVQIAKDSKQAVSGLHFQVKNTECNVFAIGEFTIGNLPTAKVKEIMKQLLSDGYYDFSDCDFQPMMFVEKYKFDEGKSKELKAEIDEEIATIEDSIAHFEIEKAKQQKKVFNIEDIRQRLNTIINLRDYKVSDEVIDMFVERIIYRGVVDGNDEFVWVMNLSGECTDTSAKYKIRGYDKNYADSLKSDRNFNIVARMLIPMEECKRFCQEEAGRRFKKKYWNPITIKIAIA